jgi:hypothetical protein
MDKFYEWKWTKGEVYYKSSRIKRDKDRDRDRDKDLNNINEDYEYENYNQINDSDNAIKQSLNGFNDLEYQYHQYDNYNENSIKFTRNENPSGNRREDLDCKISERELLFQRGTNPFLSNTNSDYVNDIETRDNFLKPKNTTSDKINNNNNNE